MNVVRLFILFIFYFFSLWAIFGSFHIVDMSFVKYFSVYTPTPLFFWWSKVKFLKVEIKLRDIRGRTTLKIRFCNLFSNHCRKGLYPHTGRVSPFFLFFFPALRKIGAFRTFPMTINAVRFLKKNKTYLMRWYKD